MNCPVCPENVEMVAAGINPVNDQITYRCPKCQLTGTSERIHSTRTAITPDVLAMAKRLTHQPSTMITSKDAHIIIDKELRRDIDAIIQRLKIDAGQAIDPEKQRPSAIDEVRRSRERDITIMKLQEAVMWLGMDLKAINDANPGSVENPYPHSKDPTNTKIDPTADGLKL